MGGKGTTGASGLVGEVMSVQEGSVMKEERTPMHTNVLCTHACTRTH